MLNRGETLHGRYQIESILGQGTFGTVYRATDSRLNIRVAVKEMRPQPDFSYEWHQKLRQHFYREAKTLAELHHTHVVNVTDYFTDNNNDYLVMRFVKGQTMASLIRQQGALPEQEVRKWALQLLDALDYCHGEGVLHRDIKPDNILIRENGDAVLVDFGLVKLWNPDNPQSTFIGIKGAGTRIYAPPEQDSSNSGNTDPRSDIYSLGATLYHALTNQMPLPANDRTASPEQFRTLQQLAPQINKQFTYAVMKAMNIVREERFASAHEMRQALLPRARTLPSISPNMIIAVLVGLVLLLLGLLIGRGLNGSGGSSSTEPVVIMETATPNVVVLTASPIETELPPTDIVPPTLPREPTATDMPQPPTETPTPTREPTATDTPQPPTITPSPTNTLEPQEGDVLTVMLPADDIEVAMVYVPAGAFTMGSNFEEDDAFPAHGIHVNAFWIDQTEVTNAQFAAFVTATHTDYENNTTTEPSDYPVVYVTWHEAVEFCEWRGAMLPTEAQWEKAARGTDARTYPWGNIFDGERLNYGGNDNGLITVGSYLEGASPYGVLDMVGNASEWTNSPYRAYPYERLDNYKNEGESMVLRGGSWNLTSDYLRVASRFWANPTSRTSNVGFRCASDF